MNRGNDGPARWLLLAGVVAGIVLAATGLLRSGAFFSSPIPEGSVAIVNGQAIPADLYQRLIVGLVEERRGGEPGEEGRRHVLERLIEEELLLQRGLELGLAHSDRLARSYVVQTMIRSIVAETQDATPDEAGLRRFYAAHADFFSRPGRMTLKQIFIRVPSTPQDAAVRGRAEIAAKRLRAGESFDRVRQEMGDDPVAPLPDGALPVEKVQEYLGPTVTQAVLALIPGEVSDPIRSGTGYHVVAKIAQEPPGVPPFAAIREEVLAQYRRVAGEQAVKTYIAGLRKRAEIQINTEMLDGDKK